MKKSDHWKPRCPNHGEPLEGLPFPLDSKGIGKCPVSGVDFEYEARTDDSQIKKDKEGNIIKNVGYQVTGDE